MTRDELKKEAEEYAIDNYENCLYDDLPYVNDRRAREEAYLAGAEPREKRIAELEKENARLKDGIALKDEEVGCIETVFNTFKSKAKEIITELLKYTDTEAVEMIKEAKQFLKDSEVKKCK